MTCRHHLPKQNSNKRPHFKFWWQRSEQPNQGDTTRHIRNFVPISYIPVTQNLRSHTNHRLLSMNKHSWSERSLKNRVGSDSIGTCHQHQHNSPKRTTHEDTQVTFGWSPKMHHSCNWFRKSSKQQPMPHPHRQHHKAWQAIQSLPQRSWFSQRSTETTSNHHDTQIVQMQTMHVTTSPVSCPAVLTQDQQR